MPDIDSGRRPSARAWLWAILALCLIALLLVTRGGMFEGRTPQQRPEQGNLQAGAAATPSAEPAAAGMREQPPPAGFSGATADSWYMPVSFRGVVLNGDSDTPVGGAKVSLFAHSSSPSVAERTTDANGKFEADMPPAYRYGVGVEADGFGPYREDSFVITRPSYNLEIHLTPVLPLRGRVVDSLSAGIPGAMVHLRRENPRSYPFLSASAGPDGAFALPVLADARGYWIEATHPGFESPRPAAVAIPSEGEILIRMKPVLSAGSLSGTVSDASQRPVGGARISLLDPGNRTISETRSDTRGAYAFARIAEGPYQVGCSADGYLDSRANTVYAFIIAGRQARLDFSLEAGSQIQGQVVNQEGEPVFQAQIIYFAEEAPRGRSPMQGRFDPAGGRGGPAGPVQRLPAPRIAATDTQGRFQITGLSDQPHQLVVSHRDYPTLSIQASPSSRPLILTLDSGLSLCGTVTDAQGSAMERINLILQSRSREKSYPFITTDGHFEIRGLSRDSYQLILQASGRERYSGAIELQSSAEVFITLGAARGGRGMSQMNILRVR